MAQPPAILVQRVTSSPRSFASLGTFVTVFDAFASFPSASALLSGPAKSAVGLESMLSQTVDRSGEKPVVTIRGGGEAEVIPQWLVVRLGSYLEPTRYAAGATRLHGTAGFSLRTIRWSVFGLFDEDTIFRVSAAVDLARDYFGWGLGAGLWL